MGLFFLLSKFKNKFSQLIVNDEYVFLGGPIIPSQELLGCQCQCPWNVEKKQHNFSSLLEVPQPNPTIPFLPPSAPRTSRDESVHVGDQVHHLFEQFLKVKMDQNKTQRVSIFTFIYIYIQIKNILKNICTYLYKIYLNLNLR